MVSGQTGTVLYSRSYHRQSGSVCSYNGERVGGRPTAGQVTAAGHRVTPSDLRTAGRDNRPPLAAGLVTRSAHQIHTRQPDIRPRQPRPARRMWRGRRPGGAGNAWTGAGAVAARPARIQGKGRCSALHSRV
jgi:hypothetical protein